MPGEDDEVGARPLCCACVGEAYLSEAIASVGETRTCAYCDTSGPTLLIEEVADHVERAFEEHFVRTADSADGWQITLLNDRESEYVWEREGEPTAQVIMNAADIPEEAADDIQEVLSGRHAAVGSDYVGEEDEFDAEVHYEERDASDAAWQVTWSEFETGLKRQARYFSREALAILASIFDGLGTLQTRDGRDIIVTAGPGQPIARLFRGRAFQAEAKLHEAMGRPDLHLGPPPMALATPGRMNALGVSVFYGASEARAAVAEVQPPVGAWVLVGQFEIIRPLRLLDLTTLAAVAASGSVFDPGTAERMSRAMFLASLSTRIARPVMPDDEPFDYLATQAIADYLATDPDLDLDGIIFPSVQTAGTVMNVVLFHKAAGLEPIDLPKGTRISARSGRWEDEGFEADFEVLEMTPPPEDKADRPPWPMDLEIDEPPDRDPALRIVKGSLQVHAIKAVNYTADIHTVSRFRFQSYGPDEPF
ncbi:RES domain-containing protein [Brevundimonas sp. S1H14]|uniref:RES domain-containing protein n=1 Tax=Brevundimonas sp. S1H14 TaxID=3078084 RepID=UPI0039EC9154